MISVFTKKIDKIEYLFKAYSCVVPSGKYDL